MPNYDYLTPAESPAQRIARKNGIFALLDQIGQELEIPESRYLEAEKRYNSIIAYLNGCPVLSRFNPHAFPQGSFALGTTVRPLHGEEYDLDFIYLLRKAYPTTYNEQQVYDFLFARLKSSGIYAGMVELKKRCVRIIYANEFHLDITPAVNKHSCPQGSIYVPDRKQRIWKPSNPQGYVNWFKPIAALTPRISQLEKSFSEGRHLVTLASAEPVPSQHEPRGILRRAVQFMKRHRDVYRENNPHQADFVPISIIITTLAAHAYRTVVSLGEYESVFDVLEAVVRLMPQFIEVSQGWPDTRTYTVKNPTIDGENFADKWQNDEGKYYKTFMAWHQALQSDLLKLQSLHGRDELQKTLQLTLGGSEVMRVFARQVQQVSQARATNQLVVPKPAPLVAAAAPLVVPRNNFYGR
ncbi:nucleotidyltransferase domain-containing protein [Hymenobacter defluvii]|uniref:Nucleotidyltransferase n=1 Tax=Hymenobacter defluvii TaxID=2054411 RepID=A0ABS3TED8_9BACT|nr:nucleotidyltransferase [Hymenobacter defluvii]MBO3272020.1 nucleotidyltransferase [Hymenobacter defluvii]